MAGLFDAITGFNNAGLGALAAPVDTAQALANLLLAGGGYAAHKAGLIDAETLPALLEATPGSSEWMRRKGLMKDNSLMGDIAGLLAPVPVPQGKADRLARMAEQGYTRGFWRGGKSVADGPFYTPDQSAARDFGKRAAGDAADVREYAVRLGNSLDFSKRYGPEDLTALRDVLKRDYGSKYADDLLSIPGDYGGRAPGAAIYQITETLSGGNARDALRAAGFDTINAGQEVVALHNRGVVRDAERALFDPQKRFDPSPFAAIGGLGLGLGLFNQAVHGE